MKMPNQTFEGDSPEAACPSISRWAIGIYSGELL